MSTKWFVGDMGDVTIIHRGFGTPDTVRSALSTHLERALALGSDLEEKTVDANKVEGTSLSEVIWTGRVPLQNVADIREFLMGMTAGNGHV